MLLRLSPDFNRWGNGQNRDVKYLIFACLSAAGLFGQHKKMNWQNACFMNPTAPYCQQREFAGRPLPAPKESPSVVTTPFSPNIRTGPASLVAVGGIDWQFAEPEADWVAGFNVSQLSASPIARSLIVQLGASQGLSEAGMKNVLAKLSALDQAAVSVRGDRPLFMLTGNLTASMLSGLAADWKAVPVGSGALLFGSAEAVDQAASRIQMKGPASEWTRLAGQQAAVTDMWALGSGRLAFPSAATGGVKRFSMTASFRDPLTIGTALEFGGVPDAAAVTSWPAGFGVASVQGNSVQTKISLAEAEVQQRLTELAASPLGERLAALIDIARYLPAPAAPVPAKAKAVIYGLDDGPREVTLAPHQ